MKDNTDDDSSVTDGGIDFDEVAQHAALVAASSRHLDVLAGLADVLTIAQYREMVRHVAGALDLPAGLQEALSTAETIATSRAPAGHQPSVARPAALAEIRVLGCFEARIDGRQVSLGGPRQRAVLARIIVGGDNPVPVDQIIDDVWDSGPDAPGDGAVHAYVSRLRKELGEDAIPRMAGGYILDADLVDIDAERFAEELNRARVAFSHADDLAANSALESALTRWRGQHPFGELVGIPFLVPEVARLQEQHAVAAELFADVHTRQGREAEDAELLELMASAYPLREALTVRLMRALYAAGRQADALSAYERWHRAQANQLSVGPTPGPAEAHAAVIAGSGVSTHQGPVTVPPRNQTFPGREPLLEDPDRYDPHAVPTDEHLRAAGRGDLTRLGQTAIKSPIPLRPREIQARIRAGASMEQVASAAGVPVSNVERFAYPVLLERSRAAEVAQRARPLHAEGPDSRMLGDVVAHTFGLRGHDYTGGEWDSWKSENGPWIVSLSWRTGRSDYTAHWTFKPGARSSTVTAIDEHASDLVKGLPLRPPRTVGLVNDENQPENTPTQPERMTAGSRHTTDTPPPGAGPIPMPTETREHAPGRRTTPPTQHQPKPAEHIPATPTPARQQTAPQPGYQVPQPPAPEPEPAPTPEPEPAVRTSTAVVDRTGAAMESAIDELASSAPAAAKRTRKGKPVMPSWDEALSTPPR